MKNERGQGLVEYALILVLVVVIAIVIVAIFRPLVENIFNPQPPTPITELNRNDYWVEVIPPPNFAGKCYEHRTDAYTHYESHSIWCIHNSEM